MFLNVTERDLLYKGERRPPRKRGETQRSRPAKGETIEHRPEEVNSRDTFGNWEMDSVMGCKGCKSALVVLTERLTRMPVIFKVPDHTMESVVRVLDRLERPPGGKVPGHIPDHNGGQWLRVSGLPGDGEIQEGAEAAHKGILLPSIFRL